MIKVRRIHGGEGAILRRMRLAALADSPGDFATTLGQAEAVHPEQWAATADAHATSDDQATFLAEDEGEVIGIVGAYRTINGVATMVGLWAVPGHRDMGVGEVLLQEVFRWSADVGARQLRLWLVERNELARAFYDRHGFEPTGEAIPYEPNPSIRQVELTREVPSSSR